MGLQGANKSAHWDGWEIENPLSCTVIRKNLNISEWNNVKTLWHTYMSVLCIKIFSV